MRVLILAADGVEDMELYYPLYRMREAGIEVEVAGPRKCRLTCKHEYMVNADLAFKDIDAGRYDALIIPGGKAPETARLDEDALRVTREMMKRGKVVGAVCHGAQVLISAGVIAGKRATSWQGVRDDVKIAGGKYEDKEVVVDGKLITSRCPDDLPAFCREMMKALGVGTVRVQEEAVGVK